MSVLSYAAAAALVALIGYVLIAGSSILLPFVIAIFLSLLINGAAAATCRIRIRGRPLPRAVRYGASIAVVGLLAWLVAGLVLHNVGYVRATAPVYEQNLLRLANRGGSWFGLDEMTNVRILFDGLDVASVLRRLTAGLTALVGSLGTVAIYTVCLLLEQHHFDRKIAALFPDAGREALVRRILERIEREIHTYVWLKTLFSAATSVASYAVMKAVGLDLAEFWALLIFALNFIPYIGAWLGVVFPGFLALVQFDAPTTPLLMTGGLAVIQFVGGSIIEPRVMGTGLNVSPVVMLLSLALWGTVWGIAGMLLAVPMMVVVMIVCSHFAATRPIAVLLSADGTVRT